MLHRLNQDFYACLAFFIFGLLILFQSFQIKQMSVGIAVGSEFVPQIVAVGIMITSLILMIKTLSIKDVKSSEKIIEDGGKLEKKSKYTFYTTIFLLIIYGLLIERVGFIIMSVLYLYLQMNILFGQGKRNHLLMAGISIGCTLFIYYLFTRVFYLLLPQGILGY